MSLAILRQVLGQEADALAALSERVGERHQLAIDWIFDCKGRVITCGIGKSGHIARKTAGTLASTGTPSLFLHAAEAVHGDLGMVTHDDIVLMYSHSGETDELVKLFPALKSIGARTLLVTGRAESSAGRLADLVIETFVTEEACPNNLAPTTSTTAMLALSDALAVAVMARRGFSPDDFAKFHPSGTLGKRLLLRVADVMRQGADVAIVRLNAPAIEMMEAITQAQTGCAVVVTDDGALLGLVTDGDLRRLFLHESEPLKFVAEQIMTAHPKTTEPDMLAVDALEYFQNLPTKIGDIPVVAGGKVVGLLALKDLLRSGIV